METYRKAIREHFENISAWKKVLGVDFLFWSLGLAFYILGGCLIIAAPTAAGIFNSLGSWLSVFGLAAAFIRKNDWGLMITTAGIALFNLVMFIVVIMLAGQVSFDLLFNVIAYGILFGIALYSSDILKNMKSRRAQEAAMLGQRIQASGGAGAVCASCGALLVGGSMFCSICGAKRPEPKKCASCGQELVDGSRFCNKCGAIVAVKTTCASCGNGISSSDIFCPGCGAKTAAVEVSEGTD